VIGVEFGVDLGAEPLMGRALAIAFAFEQETVVSIRAARAGK
jgi:hypothetical protein